MACGWSSLTVAEGKDFVGSGGDEATLSQEKLQRESHLRFVASPTTWETVADGVGLVGGVDPVDAVAEVGLCSQPTKAAATEGKNIPFTHREGDCPRLDGLGDLLYIPMMLTYFLDPSIEGVLIAHTINCDVTSQGTSVGGPMVTPLNWAGYCPFGELPFYGQCVTIMFGDFVGTLDDHQR